MSSSGLKHVVIADTSLGGLVFGGAQTLLYKLIPGLTNHGWRVSVLSESRPTDSQELELRRSGGDIVFGLWKPRMLMEDVAPRLGAWINDQNPDVYTVSVSTGAAWVALPTLRPEISVVGIAHTDSETFYRPLRHYRELLSGAVGVSEQIALKLTADCGIDASSVFHIPYGAKAIESENELEREIDKSPRTQLRLIFAGRLEQPQKRISDLVTIVKHLVRHGADFVLDIVGDGPQASEVRRALSDEARMSIVTFHGWLSSDVLISRLRLADVFILTSAYEGLPIALLEAMANGVVPVVTDLESGNRQLVAHGVNGYLAPVGDVERFVELIGSLAANRALLIRMRRNAWDTGKSFSVEKMTRNYETMFETLIASKSPDKYRRPVEDFPLMASCRSHYPLWLRRLKAAAHGVVQMRRPWRFPFDAHFKLRAGRRDK